MEILFAQGSAGVVLPSGRTVRVMKGTHWPASDPVVKMRPELFTPDPRFGLMYTEAPPGHDTELNEVEEATANPGEKRSVRRGA